jgi:uncharacterized protein YwqG
MLSKKKRLHWMLFEEVHMDKAAVQKSLTRAGLARLAEHSDLLVRNSIRLLTKPIDEANMPIGASRLGGLPDLPAHISWPAWQGVPQSFVAQLRLEELQAYDIQKLLPPKGMLWFFYAAQQDIYGDDPANKGAWQVLFAESGLEHLQRLSAPTQLSQDARFKPCALSYASELTLAVQPELEIPGLQWDNNQQKKYDTVFAAFHKDDDFSIPHHRMFGFADVLQDDMREQSQLYSLGITDWDSPEAQKLAQSANDWQLLLQVDTDETIGMRWASSGRLYYWLKAADLQAGQTSDTWFVLQSE